MSLSCFELNQISPTKHLSMRNENMFEGNICCWRKESKTRDVFPLITLCLLSIQLIERRSRRPVFCYSEEVKRAPSASSRRWKRSVADTAGTCIWGLIGVIRDSSGKKRRIRLDWNAWRSSLLLISPKERNDTAIFNYLHKHDGLFINQCLSVEKMLEN